ncbi:MAG: Type secretion system protein [Thermoanaerobaculia bacterium]|jgi:hypothetical protein|nr:Type secretion system protein [Thermoanaerobaculia bacterium]
MLKPLISIALVVLSFGTATAEPTKRELLHQMLTSMGGDAADGTPELAVFERNLSEADMRAVIAFFRTPAGLHLAATTREINKAAVRNLESAIERSKQKRTMADLRTLAVSVEAFEIDENHFPPTSDLDHLAKLITPTYLRSMVRLDGWGKEYIYVSDTKTYRILSAGPDGRLSPDSQKLGVQHGDFGDDLIFDNGEFVQPQPQPE